MLVIFGLLCSKVPLPDDCRLCAAELGAIESSTGEQTFDKSLSGRRRQLLVCEAGGDSAQDVGVPVLTALLKERVARVLVYDKADDSRLLVAEVSGTWRLYADRCLISAALRDFVKEDTERLLFSETVRWPSCDALNFFFLDVTTATNRSGSFIRDAGSSSCSSLMVARLPKLRACLFSFLNDPKKFLS